MPRGGRSGKGVCWGGGEREAWGGGESQEAEEGHTLRSCP